MVAQMCLVVDDLALCKDDAGPSMVDMWQLLPEDLVDRILAFVPASSQARLRCVCKRWSQLVTSSAFRKQSNLIAFRRGHPNFVCCRLELEAHKGAGAAHKFKVDIPDHSMQSPRVFCGAGLLGVAGISRDGNLNCWLINMGNKTFRQLPPLLMNGKEIWPGGDIGNFDCSWKIWMEPASESSNTASSYQVFLMRVDNWRIEDLNRVKLYTYSSTTGTSTGWQEVHDSSHHPRWSSCCAIKGGYVGSHSQFGNSVWKQKAGDSYDKGACARMSWDSSCTSHIPGLPSGVELISDPGSAVMFGNQWKMDIGNPPSLSLYRLDESSNTPAWTCLYSGRPPNCIKCKVEKVTFLADMLIIVIRSYCDSGFRWQGLAYHMEDGSCQWFCLPGVSTNTTVFVDPTLVSQLKL